jgi:hypothetical protein
MGGNGSISAGMLGWLRAVVLVAMLCTVSVGQSGGSGSAGIGGASAPAQDKQLPPVMVETPGTPKVDTPLPKALDLRTPAQIGAMGMLMVFDPTISPAGQTGHGWALVPSFQDSSATSRASPAIAPLPDLLHFPPVQQTVSTRPGTARVVAAIDQHIVAAAAYDGRLWLIGGTSMDDGRAGPRRMITTLRATGPLAEGAWNYRPLGRLELAGQVPADGRLTSVAGSSAGLLIAMDHSDATRRGGLDGTGRFSLRAMDPLGWTHIALPSELEQGSQALPVLVVPANQGVMVMQRGGTDGMELRVWAGAVTRTVIEVPKPAQEDRAAWRRDDADVKPTARIEVAWGPAQRLKLPAEFASAKAGSDDQELALVTPGMRDLSLSLRPVQVLNLAGQIVVARAVLNDAGQTRMLELFRLTQGDPVRLDAATDREVFASMAMGGVPGAMSVRVVGLEIPEVTTPTGRLRGQPERDVRRAIDLSKLRVMDVSLISGKSSEPRTASSGGLLTRRDFQTIWLLFLVIGAILLVMVIRAGGGPSGAGYGEVAVFPEGWAIASRLWRVIAGAIDIVVGLALTGLVFGMGPATALKNVVDSSGAYGLGPLMVLIAGGWLVGTLAEWLTGKTLGKGLVGLAVITNTRTSPATNAKGEANQPEVAQAAPVQPRKPGLGNAALRNAVKWFLSPLATLFLVDPAGRHPGDTLAKTYVIQAFEAEQDGTPGDDNQGR